MQDDATWKQCKVMVTLAEMLAEKDPELAGRTALGRTGDAGCARPRRRSTAKLPGALTHGCALRVRVPPDPRARGHPALRARLRDDAPRRPAPSPSEIGRPVVIKSQVLTGGRMKAGGVKFADTPEEAEAHARDILALEIGGHMPRGVLVDARAADQAGVLRGRDLRRRAQAAHVRLLRHGRDRHRGGGRVAIPTTSAAATSRRSCRTWTSARRTWSPRSASPGRELNRLTPILSRLARLFVKYDMTLAEINPLAQLEDGTFVAVDAHMDMENEARAAAEGAPRGARRGRRGDARGARAHRRSRSRASGSTPSTTAAWPGTSPSSTATSAS